jgi:hypothetical protein
MAMTKPSFTRMAELSRPGMRLGEEYWRNVLALARNSTGGHVGVGRGGTTINYTNAYGGRSSHTADSVPTLRALAAEEGVPYVDTTGVEFDTAARVAIRGAMVAFGEDHGDPPYHCLSYAPLAVWCEVWRLAGAIVENITPSQRCVDLAAAEFARIMAPRVEIVA